MSEHGATDAFTAALQSGRIVRSRVIERIANSSAKIVAIVTPLGYGRKSLVKAIAAPYARFARLDFRSVVDEATFRRAIGEAIATLGGERDVPSVIVFENAGALNGHGAWEDACVALVDALPRVTRVVFSADRPLAILGRFAPHTVFAVGVDDLRLDADEIARLCGDGVSAGTVRKIETFTEGWAVAVLLAVRLLREGRFDEVAFGIGDLAVAVVDYLVANVFEVLEPADFEALLDCAAIPDLRAEEAPAAIVARLPFVTRASGTIVVHPLVRAALRVRYRELWNERLRAWSARRAAAGDAIGAASCALEVGDDEAAARALDTIDSFYFEEMPPSFRRLAVKIEPLLLALHPNVWANTMYLRRFTTNPQTLLVEARMVASQLPANAPAALRANVACVHARILADIGRCEEALTLLEAVVPAGSTEMAHDVIPVAAYRAAVLTDCGDYDAALVHWQRATRDAQPKATMRAYGLQREMRVFRARGRRDDERMYGETAIRLAVRSDEDVTIAFALAEAAFGAWLAGEDDAHRAYVDRLATVVERYDAVTFRAYVEAASGARPVFPAMIPRWRTLADLTRAGAAAARGDTDGARSAARDAYNAAREAADPQEIVYACIAVAATNEPVKAAMLLEAAAAAESIDAPELRGAVADVASGAPGGMLAPLVARFNALALAAPSAGRRFHLAYLSGEVTANGVPIDLSDLNRALLFALGSVQRPTTREELFEMLWPASDDRSAANALRMCVSRVRAALGDAHAVVWTKDGYTLAESAGRDLPAIEAAVKRLRSDPGDAPALTLLVASLVAIAHGRPSRLATAEWFEPIEARIVRLGTQIGAVAGAAALAQRRWSDALTLAAALQAIDSYDEAACALEMRALIGSGDVAAARGALRAYEAMIRRELDTAPSPALRALLPATGTLSGEPGRSPVEKRGN